MAARLALLLLSGQGMPEAAATLGISRNTAHSQLASIFRSRREELFRNSSRIGS